MSEQLVVGAAIVRGARVLAARRTAPPEVAGRWELPGGKVEPGETRDAALVREIGEELGCRVGVDAWLAGRSPILPGLVLEIAIARFSDSDTGTGTGADPEPVEHDEIRWLRVDELGDVDWLESDRPFLPAIATVLVQAAGR